MRTLDKDAHGLSTWVGLWRRKGAVLAIATQHVVLREFLLGGDRGSRARVASQMAVGDPRCSCTQLEGLSTPACIPLAYVDPKTSTA